MAGISSNKVYNVPLVSNATDAANKNYVDYRLISRPSYSASDAGDFLYLNGDCDYVAYSNPLTNNIFNRLTYRNNNFLLSDSNGGLSVSTDAVNWTLRTSGFNTNYISDVIYDGTNYLAGGQNGVLNASTNLINWRLRTSSVSATFSVESLSYGSQIYVVAASSNTLDQNRMLSSTNGVEWTLRTIGFSNTVTSVVFNPTVNEYVGVGYTSRVSTSTDAINWTLRTLGFRGGSASYYSNIYTATYGNGYYIAGGSVLQNTTTLVEDFLSASTDGIIWLLRTVGINYPSWMSNKKGILFSEYANFKGQDYYVCSGAQFSTDTVVWTNTDISSGFSTDVTIGKVGNNLVVVGLETSTSPNRIAYSKLANIQWIKTSADQSTLNPYSSQDFVLPPRGRWVFRTSGRFYIPPKAQNFYIELSGAGGGGNSGFSGGGNNAAGKSGLSGSGNYVLGAGGGGGGYKSWILSRNEFGSANYFDLSIGSGGRGANCLGLCSSTDGIIWRSENSNLYQTINTAIFGNNLYLVAGPNGRLSSNDTTYTTKYAFVFRTSGFSTNAINTLAFGSGETESYIAAGVSGILRTSTNSIQWTTRTSGFGASVIDQVKHDGSIYLAVGASGILNTSTDGISWTAQVASFGTSTINDVTYGLSNYIAAGVSGILNTSTDAINWTLRTSGFSTNAINTLVFGSGETESYIAAGVSGILNTSTDAINWTLRTSGFGTTSINALTHTGNIYVAAGASGILNTSTDGIIWVLRSTLFKSGSINALTFGSGKIIAGGEYLQLGTAGSGTTLTWYDYSGYGRVQLFAPGGAGPTEVSGGSGANVHLSGNELGPIVISSGSTGGKSTQDEYAEVLLGGVIGTTSVSRTINRFQPTGGSMGMGWAPGLAGVGTFFPRTQREEKLYYGNSFGKSSDVDGKNGITVGNIGMGGEGGLAVLNGTDGNAWESQGVVPKCDGIIIDVSNLVAYGNGIYLLNGSNFTGILASTNALVWTLRTSPLGTGSLIYGTYGSDVFIVSSGEKVLSSTDSIVWTNRYTIPRQDGTYDRLIRRIIYHPDIGFYLVAISTLQNTIVGGEKQNYAMASTNGIFWVVRTLGAVNNENVLGNAVAYCANASQKYLYRSLQNMMSSTNGIVWTARTAVYTRNSSSVNLISSNDFFVSQWTPSTSIVTNDDGAVAAGAAGTCFTGVSTNGIVWSLRTIGRTYGGRITSIDSLGYDPVSGVYIIGNYNLTTPQILNTVSISTDTINWSMRTTSRSYYATNSSYFSYADGPFISDGQSLYGTAEHLTYPGILAINSNFNSYVGNGGHGGTGGGGGGGGGNNSQIFGVGGDGGNGMATITWW